MCKSGAGKAFEVSAHAVNEDSLFLKKRKTKSKRQWKS